MGSSELSKAVLGAGGDAWYRRTTSDPDPWPGLILGGAMLAGAFGYGVWLLCCGSPREQPLARYMVGVPCLVLLMVGAWRLWHRDTVTAVALLRRARAMESALRGDEVGEAVVSGVASTAGSQKVPVMLREVRSMGRRWQRRTVIKMTSRPFVAAGEMGVWLVDSPCIELVGGIPSRHGVRAVHGELAVHLGQEVLVMAQALDDVQAPSWFEGDTGLSRYRERRIRRAVGSDKDPVRVWALPDELE